MKLQTDPNAALDAIRSASAYLLADPADLNHGYSYREQVAREDAADTLAVATKELDQWLSSGGFLPAAWRAVQTEQGYRHVQRDKEM